MCKLIKNKNMNIALVGYGKMGKAIEQIAKDRGHNIALIVDKNNLDDLNVNNLKDIDVAIEFSTPETAVSNYKKCFDALTPVVSGTTGWLSHKKEVEEYCKSKGSAFFYASNFSLGVNLFFELNKNLAKLMSSFSEYDVKVNEVHHTQKLDAPSGTAITIAEGIISEYDNLTSWKNSEQTNNNELSITSERIGDVSGIHEVFYTSENDTISIKHTAHSRKGFALGAVLSAEFLCNKKGIFTMSDLLSGLNTGNA